jgi:thiamine pyrophosphokinase
MELILSLNGEFSDTFENNDIDKDAIIVAADGGIRHLNKLNLVPHYVVGDFDSTFMESDSRTINILNQNLTDFQKALQFVFAKYPAISKLKVIGATGGRFDHLMNNMHIISRIDAHISIIIYGKYETIYRVTPTFHFSKKLQINTIISIIPFENARNVTTNGLQWNLKGHDFNTEIGFSQSNKTMKQNVEIKIDDGIVYVSVLKTRL